MGSSFVDYRGHGFWSRDGFIEEFLERLAKELESLPAADWTRAAVDHWRLQASGIFSGWVHPKFDELLASDDRRDEIVNLVARIRAGAGSSQHLRETCDLVERLLRGELTTDASSPLDYMVGRDQRPS
ncbi:MAG: hypothetical protein L6R28_15095 [Planctomycetes bacterium]|nr:hypothetical protein [Planctomycetota bacterium]